MSKGILKKKFANMKLTGKLIFIYLLAGFVPVVITLGITYLEMRKILWDRETTILESYLTQTTDAMDNEIEIYNNISKYISYNQAIAKILSADQSAYQNYEQFTSVIDPLLSSIMYFHDEVEQVTIYTDACDVRHGDTVAPLSDFPDTLEMKGYDDNKIHWYIDEDNGKAYSISRMSMLEQKGAKGILYVAVSYDSLFQPFFKDTSFGSYGLRIDDSYGRCIFEKNTFAADQKSYVLDEEAFQNLRDSDNSGYQFINMVSESNGWNICIYKPDRLIISSVRPILLVASVALFGSLVAVIASICITSEFIIKRIRKLQKNMKETEAGNLGTVIENDSTDEIGDLIDGYNNMTKRLGETIDEVYKSKIKEKEYEMRALQAQINPHFLYNTLSMINWKALEAEQEDISSITLSLSTFYRTALNKGKNILLVRDEIANSRSYLDIQLAMHDNSFDVEYDIDDSILKYETLNLILQPLLENAIVHGIDVKTDGSRGKICIEGRENGDFLDLAVIDNGVGMTGSQAALILSKSSNGYGVSNVNERIKLYYGEEYALKIESTPGVGTTIRIHFPKQ